MATHNTRSRTDVWLIGRCFQNAFFQPHSKCYRHFTIIMQQPPSLSLKLTIDELLSIWASAQIPTALHQNISCKLRSLVDEYNLMKKNKSRHSDTQRCHEEQFKTKLKLLFDVSHKDAENFVKIEEDKLFLEDQRGMRKMVMAGVDEQLTQKEERSAHRRLT